ncbi:MAG: alpha/beta hydrolase [Deltaproteobacteria bacterium]|nr:alpha/beta hydrolase [Deltaproteobacteria bacterium]
MTETTSGRHAGSLRYCAIRATCSALALAAALADAASSQASPLPQAPTSAGIELVETTYKSVDATVAAQWEFPARTPAPLVVIVPASESLDRNGLPPGYGEDPATGIYSQLAAKLLDAGFAVFRYDAPGTGRSSPGRYSTVRSTALEGYTRAVDHAKVDPDHVYLLGHAAGTDTVVGIYSRYEAVRPLAGVILLSNRVGETDMVQVLAPTLLIVTDKTPDDVYQHGQFPADARSRFADRKLETKLVTIPGAEQTMLAPIAPIPSSGASEAAGAAKHASIDPRAVAAILDWLQAQRTSARRN